jgi:hypothetical protein
VAGSYKSLGRDPALGRADTLRRRDALGVQRALSDSSSAATATEATVTDLVARLERLERLESLLAYLEDPSQIVSLWGFCLTDGAGGVSMLDGHGIASVVLSGNSVLVTFSDAMANNDYVVAGSRMTGGTGGLYGGSETYTTVLVSVWTAAGQVALSTTALDFGVAVIGRRA